MTVCQVSNTLQILLLNGTTNGLAISCSFNSALDLRVLQFVYNFSINGHISLLKHISLLQAQPTCEPSPFLACALEENKGADENELKEHRMKLANGKFKGNIRKILGRMKHLNISQHEAEYIIRCTFYIDHFYDSMHLNMCFAVI